MRFHISLFIGSLGVALVCASAGGCGDNQSPTAAATTTTTTNDAGSTGTGSTDTGTSGNNNNGTTTTDGGTTKDGGNTSNLAACDANLKDKVTTCTVGTSPSCAKSCGPDLADGSSQSKLGNKECDCNASGVYICQSCVYETPIPGCYVPSATPTNCPAVVDGTPCTTVCTGNGTGNDVCTRTTSAGKTEGCVCVQGKDGPTWTCATSWW